MMGAMTDSRHIVEDAPGYDEARAVWNAMVDRRPREIARCAVVRRPAKLCLRPAEDRAAPGEPAVVRG